jgi:hypothetical protein
MAGAWLKLTEREQLIETASFLVSNFAAERGPASPRKKPALSNL